MCKKNYFQSQIYFRAKRRSLPFLVCILTSSIRNFPYPRREITQGGSMILSHLSHGSQSTVHSPARISICAFSRESPAKAAATQSKRAEATVSLTLLYRSGSAISVPHGQRSTFTPSFPTRANSAPIYAAISASQITIACRSSSTHRSPSTCRSIPSANKAPR